jgi:hypothetical protein
LLLPVPNPAGGTFGLELVPFVLVTRTEPRRGYVRVTTLPLTSYPEWGYKLGKGVRGYGVQPLRRSDPVWVKGEEIRSGRGGSLLHWRKRLLSKKEEKNLWRLNKNFHRFWKAVCGESCTYGLGEEI